MAEQKADKTPGLLHKFRAKFVSLALSLAIVGTCGGMLWHHYQTGNGDDLISQMESKLLDQRFRLRGEQKPTGKVAILAIDEKALQKFGRWPITRKSYEQALRNLQKIGAGWLGFDVVWAENELPQIEDVVPNLARLEQLTSSKGVIKPGPVSAELQKIEEARQFSVADRHVARAIKDYGKVVLGFFYYASKTEAQALGKTPFRGLEQMANSEIQALVMPDGKELKDYPVLKSHGIVGNSDFIAGNAENFAFFNNESDVDAIMRWVTLVREMDGKLMPSLSLKLAAMALGREPVVFFDEFGINDISLVNLDDDTDLIKIPVDHNGFGRILINHYGPDKTIKHYSLADAFDDNFTAAERAALKGTTLILGPTAIAINDQRANPFDAGINGVENHAAVVDNIIAGNFMRRSESIYLTELLIVVGIGLLFAPIMIFGKAALSGLSALLFLVGYYYFDKYMWFGKGEWVYMGMPFIEITTLYIGNTLYKYVTEEREKKKVKGAFSMYLSPEVITQVLDDPSALRLGGEKKELTVFFSDVRSFTTISESLTPEKLCELMNDYFTPMTSIILRSKGVLDKYIGDAIMAFWGAPIKVDNQADIACQASLEMLVALDKLRVDLPKKGFPVIDIGIGLNTGPMSVGNMGSGERFCYTVMGDAVNLGARLEGLTKDYGIKILISQFTQAKITRKDIFTRDLDDIRVKGKLEPVKVFELMRPDILRTEQAIRDLIGEFEGGRLAYRNQDWDKARKHFMACLNLRPDDGPANLFLERIEERAAQPSIPQWDGVYTFKHK